MSEAITEVEAVDLVADGSTVSNGGRLAEIAASAAAIVKRGLSTYRGMTTQLKDAARLRVEARSLILNAAGNPDWSAQTDTYRTTVGAAEAEVWTGATPDEKRRVDGAIRQHIARTFLEPGIVAYVFEHTPNLGVTASELKWTEEKNGSPSVPAGDVPEALKTAVRAQYESAGLTVPTKYGGQGRQTGGGSPSEPVNPAAVLANMTVAVESLAPLAAAEAILGAMVALSRKVEGETPNRAKVLAAVSNIGRVAILTAKNMDGKATDADIDTLRKTRGDVEAPAAA